MPPPDPAAARDERLDFVQALRGIAALLVVCYHSRLLVSGPAYHDAGRVLFDSAAAGVDLFFVISGFIMVHTTWRSDGSPASVRRFFVRRLTRLWPVYMVVTIVYLLVRDGSLGLLARRVSALFFYPASPKGAPFFGYAPLDVGWTLDHEVWFYVLFGLAMLAGRQRWRVLAAAFVGFGVVLPLVLTGHVEWDAYQSYGLRPVILDLAMSPMAAEFAAGVGIGLIVRSRWRVRAHGVRVALLVVTGAALLAQYFSGFRAGHGPLRWGLTLVPFVLALALADRERRLRVPRVLLWLGEISFSLYLVQRLPQVALPSRFPDGALAAFFASGAYFFVSTALALGLAQLSWRWLERGLAERARRWILPRLA